MKHRHRLYLFIFAFTLGAMLCASLGGCNATADGFGRLLEGMGRDVQRFAEPEAIE